MSLLKRLRILNKPLHQSAPRTLVFALFSGALWLQGCGALPPNTERVQSLAQAPVADSPLVQIDRQIHQKAQAKAQAKRQKPPPQANAEKATKAVKVATRGDKGNPNKPISAAAGQAVNPATNPTNQAGQNPEKQSAFLLLDTPESAYAGRLALVRKAAHTLDLQYYAIHADAGAHALLDEVRKAAERGVRVRLLLDDYNSNRDDAKLMQLAFVPNIEMRLFNPLTGGHGLGGFRFLYALPNLKYMQRRMHNKLFLADNVMGILGGRNLGDTYFGLSGKNNFADLDVLVSGPLVQEMSAGFDAYWNHQLAYPVQTLLSAQERQALQAGGTPEQTGKRRIPQKRIGDPVENTANRQTARDSQAQQEALSDTPSDTVSNAKLSSRIEPETSGAAQAIAPIALEKAPWTRAPSRLLTDPPSKFAKGKKDPNPNVVDQILRWAKNAQNDVLIVSPYFVPTKKIRAQFRAWRQQGIRVRVLTNSLASNDAPVAHIGYARYRRKLLKMGVELYEMKAEQSSSALSQTFGSSGRASNASLHAKLLVLDGEKVAIGSMNLDARSHYSNSEVAVIIDDAELAQRVAEQVESVLRNAAWHVTLKHRRKLQWHMPSGEEPPVNQAEPDANIPLQLLLKLIGPFTPEDLL